MIGDLHGRSHGRGNGELLAQIRHMKPDLAMTVGDMMFASPDFDISGLLLFYEELIRICPVFVVNGNHETKIREHTVNYGTIYKEYDHELRRMGAAVLNNRSATVTLDGMPIRVTGYEAPPEKYRKFRINRLRKEELVQAVGVPDPSCYTILLAHSPAFAKTYFDWGADLVLSGHYHGGLIRIGDQPIMSPYGFPFPRYGYGLIRHGSQSMVVTAGAGDHAVALRIGNPHEIVQVIIDHGEENNVDPG